MLSSGQAARAFSEHELTSILSDRAQMAAIRQEAAGPFAGTVSGEPSILQLSLNLPGLPKRTTDSLRCLELAFAEASIVLTGAGCRPVSAKAVALRSVDVMVAVFLAPAPRVKLLSARFEDAHQAGRLFDFDVYSSGVPVSRRRLGLAPRRCFLCAREARSCCASSRHAIAELRTYALGLMQCYVNDSRLLRGAGREMKSS